MSKQNYFNFLSNLNKLKLINKFSNFIIHKNNKKYKKKYKYYIKLIKQYRYLNIFSFKTIKFITIK
uniref:ORF-F n=1 Tax=Cyclospora cayetanensis TaxID=88456 RepID=A0A0K0NU23_9EIME|nr:ORF-F [Cyclospora cayetanensis]AKO71991.1 ORF-F [Cyclospora cayetanensis]ANJ44346.1 ORF-F [Cyclospora cayetanensis]ANN13280.1 ORF-F [Cyclospora cayetanensis]ANN13309.1 ORF-F [Cyclospora cayetanensis]ANN13338.1 ORF-F [Cyclospora cayetanensis]